jgi:putative hydrolase of HD superfamily
MKQICQPLGKIGDEIMSLWSEYENASTPEGKIAKDFDKFEMIMQAYEYEKGITVYCRTFF